MFHISLPAKRIATLAQPLLLLDQSEVDYRAEKSGFSESYVTLNIHNTVLHIVSNLTMGELFDIVSTHANWYSYDHALPQMYFDGLLESGADTRGVWVYKTRQDYSGSFFSFSQAIAVLAELVSREILTGKALYESYIDHVNGQYERLRSAKARVSAA